MLTDDQLNQLGVRFGFGTMLSDDTMLWFDGNPSDMIRAAVAEATSPHSLESPMSRILFKKHLPNAIIPTKGSEHAAAFDLYAAAMDYDASNQQAIIDTGLTVAFDTGHALFLFGRSGHAMKYGIRLSNCVGVIDADYRGPLKVLLRSDSPNVFHSIQIGDRVAQAILMPVPEVEWVSVETLSDTVRGEGGFGSTGSR